MTGSQIFTSVTVACVVGAVVWGFWVVGSPESRRLQRLDDLRLQHLQAIVHEIDDRVRDREDTDRLRQPLPQSLEPVAEGARHEKIVLADPQTGVPYGYTVKSETTYELCATFAGVRDEEYDVFWNHPAGAHSFLIDALNPP